MGFDIKLNIYLYAIFWCATEINEMKRKSSFLYQISFPYHKFKCNFRKILIILNINWEIFYAFVHFVINLYSRTFNVIYCVDIFLLLRKKNLISYKMVQHKQLIVVHLWERDSVFFWCCVDVIDVQKIFIVLH
jgi:hypothetical protein